MHALRQKALELLARREHSKYELQQKLITKGFAVELVEVVLVELAQSGLQSDQRFSEAYLHHRSAAGYGPKQIAVELRQRGITEFPTLLLRKDDDYWQQLLQQVWQKKFAGLPKNAREYGRQMRFLLHRGFAMTQIKHLLLID